MTIATEQFVKCDGNNDQHFTELPTLAELNQELSGCTEDEVMAELWPDEEEEVPPKPHYELTKSVLLTNSNSPPKINALYAYLLHSHDQLFFIDHRVSYTSVYEWQLFQIAYEDTMEFHPNCLQDRMFLVAFFIMHPEENDYYAINQ